VKRYAQLALLLASFFVIRAAAQDQPAPAPPQQPGQPQIQITYLNVCAPDADEKQSLSSALDKIPLKPPFAADFEVARGHTSISSGELAARLSGGAASASNWVRMRREFASGYYASVEYLMTRDDKGISEILVFRVRDPKDLMQTTISVNIASTDPATVLKTDTPAARIKLERFGKSSVGLTRCPGADQRSYEPLFQGASHILSSYRDLLGVRRTVAAEFARLGTSQPAKPGKTAAAPPAAEAKKP
jgi:hypothetical protein